MSSIKLVIETLFPKFQVVSIVRQNNYKKTIIVRRSGHKYMLRLFNIEGISKERVQNVIKVLDKISKQKNPHILKFYEAIFDQELTYLGIVSEYIEHQYSCPQSETQIWEIVSQVLYFYYLSCCLSINYLPSKKGTWQDNDYQFIRLERYKHYW